METPHLGIALDVESNAGLLVWVSKSDWKAFSLVCAECFSWVECEGFEWKGYVQTTQQGFRRGWLEMTSTSSWTKAPVLRFFSTCQTLAANLGVLVKWMILRWHPSYVIIPTCFPHSPLFEPVCFAGLYFMVPTPHLFHPKCEKPVATAEPSPSHHIWFSQCWLNFSRSMAHRC